MCKLERASERDRTQGREIVDLGSRDHYCIKPWSLQSFRGRYGFERWQSLSKICRGSPYGGTPSLVDGHRADDLPHRGVILQSFPSLGTAQKVEIPIYSGLLGARSRGYVVEIGEVPVGRPRGLSLSHRRKDDYSRDIWTDWLRRYSHLSIWVRGATREEDWHACGTHISRGPRQALQGTLFLGSGKGDKTENILRDCFESGRWWK